MLIIVRYRPIIKIDISLDSIMFCGVIRQICTFLIIQAACNFANLQKGEYIDMGKMYVLIHHKVEGESHISKSDEDISQWHVVAVLPLIPGTDHQVRGSVHTVE